MRNIPVVMCILIAACSFDYGQTKAGGGKPDIVMHNVEYVRVRKGEPQVRFEAEYAERYETQKIMNLENFTFEEFQEQGARINTSGRAGEASVELDTGNIVMSGGVRIAVDSEDLTIETVTLHWIDKPKQLIGPLDDLVEVRRSDGTIFIGSGFMADARERTWLFESGAEGIYVDEDEPEAEMPQSDTGETDT